LDSSFICGTSNDYNTVIMIETRLHHEFLANDRGSLRA